MISDIRLQQFRSYTDASFSFNPGVNIIVGPNGSGKTNLLEAVLVLARGSSYRVGDSELMQFDADWFRLDAHIDGAHERIVKFKTVPRPTKNYTFDEKQFLRLTMQHMIPTVLFEPNHLQLLHGTPDGRRNYLDDILEQTQPGFSSFRRNYRRVLAQRNALLKRSKQPSTQELFPWNLRLSELGATITRARAELCEQLADELPKIYRAISQSNTEVSLRYLPKFQLVTYESDLLAKLEGHINEDYARGFTSYGPHREDFLVTYNEKPADEYASRGETRTAVLALKIIELQLLEKVRGVAPLLLLDDVFSELDTTRRSSLISFLSKNQTFITTTDADTVMKDTKHSTVITF